MEQDLAAFAGQGFAGHVTEPIAASDLLGALLKNSDRTTPETDASGGAAGAAPQAEGG